MSKKLTNLGYTPSESGVPKVKPASDSISVQVSSKGYYMKRGQAKLTSDYVGKSPFLEGQARRSNKIRSERSPSPKKRNHTITIREEDAEESGCDYDHMDYG